MKASINPKTNTLQVKAETSKESRALAKFFKEAVARGLHHGGTTLSMLGTKVSFVVNERMRKTEAA